MDLNLSVFQEPRGVMRIFQFIFSIFAFATTAIYTGYVNFICSTTVNHFYEYDYPFNLYLNKDMDYENGNISCHERVTISGDFSSDAKFFVTTGVLAMLVSLISAAVYAKFDELYDKNTKFPLADFGVSVLIAILWLASSAAWANGLSGLKHVTDADNMHWDHANPTCQSCPVIIGNFQTLNISVILGFLNFVLWAADLWFIYKETVWFQNPNTVDMAAGE